MPCSVEIVVYSDARKQNRVRPPTMRAAMERREAPGLLARARAPRDPSTPQAPWVPESWRVAGSRKPGRGRSRKPPWAPPGAPFPSLWEGEGKQGDGRSRASEKQNPGTAERWLFAPLTKTTRPAAHHAAGRVGLSEREVRLVYRQNNASRMMIGNGMPSSHSNIPFPKPMLSSVLGSADKRHKRRKVPPAQIAFGFHHTSTTPMVEAASPATAIGDRCSPSSSSAMMADAPGTTKKPDEARPAP